MNRTLVWLGLLSWSCGGSAFENADETDTGGSAGRAQGGRATGGTSASGGNRSGGTSATGGNRSGGTGGTPSTGGSPSSGGNAQGGTATGGSDGHTGGDATGGTSAGGSSGGRGGSTARGGTSGTGGTSKGGAGGTGGTGGTSKGGAGGTATGGSSSGGATAGTGATGGATAGTGGATAGTGGTGGLTCQELSSRYQVVLGQARACNPGVPDPCTVKVDTYLLCGCPTFVSQANQAQIDELASLVKEAQSRSCAMPCPPVLCVVPTGASCEATVSTGSDEPYACRVTSGVVTQ